MIESIGYFFVLTGMQVDLAALADPTTVDGSRTMNAFGDAGPAQPEPGCEGSLRFRLIQRTLDEGVMETQNRPPQEAATNRNRDEDALFI